MIKHNGRNRRSMKFFMVNCALICHRNIKFERLSCCLIVTKQQNLDGSQKLRLKLTVSFKGKSSYHSKSYSLFKKKFIMKQEILHCAQRE